MDWTAFLDETEARIGRLAHEAPEMSKAFGAMGRTAKTPGALDEATKELIALGIAISTRCDSCIGFHARTLARLGTPRARIVETLEMATYMGGGPSFAHGAKALEAFDHFAAVQDGAA